MSKFFTILTVSALLAGAAQAAPVAKLTPAKTVRTNQMVRNTHVSTTPMQRAQELLKGGKSAFLKSRSAKSLKMPRKAIVAPDSSWTVKGMPDSASLKTGVKEGVYAYSNFFQGDGVREMNYDISKYQIVNDTLYLGSPFCGYGVNGVLTGVVKDSVVTFTFPQLADHLEMDIWGTVLTLDTYALRCDFVPSPDDPESGEYVPGDKQTMTFAIQPDGSLVNTTEGTDTGDVLLGACDWVTEEYDEGIDDYVPIDNPYYEWNGNGDLITSISEFKETPVTAPATAKFEDWNFIDSELLYGRTVGVAVDDANNAIYVKGLLNMEGTEEYVAKGDIKGNKVSFPTGQYMGTMEDYNGLLFLVGASFSADGESVTINDAVEFDYDKAAKKLTGKNVMVLNGTPDVIYYYDYYANPDILVPDATKIAEEVYDPVVLDYLAASEEEEGGVAFIFPNVDRAGNILAADKLFYNVLVNDTVYVLDPEVYPMVTAGAKNVKDIPWGATDEMLETDLTQHVFYFEFMGYDSLAIQTLYKDGANEKKSAVVYAYKGEGSIDTLGTDTESVSESYYDLTGRRISTPCQGVSIRRSVTADGRVIVSKHISK